MARHEKDIDASGAQPLSAEQVRALLGPAAGGDTRRAEAAACFLAGAEGWEQAAELLGGTFANCRAGLMSEKSE